MGQVWLSTTGQSDVENDVRGNPGVNDEACAVVQFCGRSETIRLRVSDVPSEALAAAELQNSKATAAVLLTTE